jgi:hypothetical protein
VASASGLVNGLLSAAVLALSARNGQTDEIAAYSVMSAALAFVTIAVSGGSSILYISGNAEQRRAVRSQWVYIVLPSLIVGTVAISAVYSRWGYAWSALLAAGVVTIGNNLITLQLGDLSREMRYTSNALVICGSKLSALVLVVAGMRLTHALLLSGVIQFALAEVALRRTSWLRRSELRELSPRAGLSVFRTNMQLFSYTTSELYNGRIGTLVLSLFVTPRAMGCYGAVASAYQALCGVLCSGLQVSLVARTRARHGIDAGTVRGRDAEIIAVAGSAALAVCTAVAAPVITNDVLRLPLHDSTQWLRILVVALPFMVLNRAATFVAIGEGSYLKAARVVLLVSVFMTPVVLLAVPTFGAVGAASATLTAESFTALVIGLIVIRRRAQRPSAETSARTVPVRLRSAGIVAFRRSRSVTASVTAASIEGNDRRFRTGTAALMWLSLGVAGLAPDVVFPVTGARYSTVALSCLCATFGLWVFWRHGIGRITAIGVYNFAFALFVGFAGLYDVAVPPPGLGTGYLLAAVACCYFVQVPTWALFWSKDAWDVPRELSLACAPAVARWSVTTGSCLLGAAVLVTRLRGASVPFMDAIGFVGIVLMAIGLLCGAPGRQWMFRSVVIAGAFGVYVHFLFDGFGRVILGSLAFSLAIVLTHRLPGRLVKSVVILATAPGLLLLAKLRIDDVSASRPDVGLYENGLESVVSPLRSFATLLMDNRDGVLPMGWGHTFFTALVSLTPRGLWPGKPAGFGNELVPFISPALVGTGHSDAALFPGEWLFNFGLPGLLIMIPAVGLALRILDHLLNRPRSLDSGRDLVHYAMVLVTAAGVVDLSWVGTFSYAARTGERLAVLVVILAAAALRKAPGPVAQSPPPNRTRDTWQLGFVDRTGHGREQGEHSGHDSGPRRTNPAVAE